MPTATTAADPAGDLLRRLTGDPAAAFRPGQREAVDRLVARRGRVLVVQRTGWGKSAVYFLATRLLRDRGAGPTLLISPLLALMRNQLVAAERAGVRAATIHSENADDWAAVEAQVRDGDVDLLLVSPERLNNPRFRREVLPGLVRGVGLLVVDEAHCISDWGHDFRPDYRRIARVVEALPGDVPVLCTTATANDRVVHDIVAQLGNDLEVIRGTLERASLRLGVVDLPEQASRLAWLATVVPTLAGSGIVYCATVADTGKVAGWLRSQGIDAVEYSGESEHHDRVAVEEDLLAGRVKVVVATSALGMGFDKPDLSFVVHYQSPGSPVAYYQQVGRAGRAVDDAVVVLLRGREDAAIQDHFIRTAFPPRPQAERVVALLEEHDAPVPLAEIEAEVNAPRTRIEGMMKVLEVEGAVERAGRGWQRAASPWAYDEERVQRVTALRREEQAAMADYATGGACRMAWLRSSLDDRVERPCGRCDVCTGEGWGVPLDPGLVAEAVGYLRGAVLAIEPRRQWPSGLAEVRGRIAPERQLQVGRALCAEGDGGWGAAVRRAVERAGDGDGGGGSVPEEVVAAAVDVVRRWAPDPAPAWVTWVPSASSPALVADVAGRLGEALALPVREALRRVRRGRPQRDMRNSAQQVANVLGAFEVADAVPAGPVLLVDDAVASRWTLTVAGAALREAGSGVVHPFALMRR